MTYQVELHKTFVGGMLAGLSVTDRVPFTTWQGAADFARTMQGKTVLRPCGGSPYRVDFAFADVRRN